MGRDAPARTAAEAQCQARRTATGARRMGQARRARPPRPPAHRQGSRQAARAAEKPAAVYRRRSAFPATGAAPPGIDQRGGLLRARRFGQHDAAGAAAGKEFLLFRVARNPPPIRESRHTLHCPHHAGMGIFRGRFFPGHRHRRHRRLDRVQSGAAIDRRRISARAVQHLPVLCIRRREFHRRPCGRRRQPAPSWLPC